MKTKKSTRTRTYKKSKKSKKSKYGGNNTGATKRRRNNNTNTTNTKRFKINNDDKIQKLISLINNENMKLTSKPFCDYNLCCYRQNPEHKKNFYHYYNFNDFTNKFLSYSYDVYKKSNNDLLPFQLEWYSSVIHLLRESDFTKHSSLYFNLLVNTAINIEKYYNTFGYQFLYDVFFGLEQEGVTGIYNINKPNCKNNKINDIYKKYNLVDDKYNISNTHIIRLIDKIKQNN